jgi:hypothetical protein
VLPGQSYNTLEGRGNKCVWSNSALLISKGEPKKRGKAPVELPLNSLRVSRDVTCNRG